MRYYRKTPPVSFGQPRCRSKELSVKVDAVKDLVTPLKKHFDFLYILAKAVSYKRGTSRFFSFELSEIPVEKSPRGEIDGTINLVFSESLTLEDVKKLSSEGKQAILYGVYQNTKQIRGPDLCTQLAEDSKREAILKVVKRPISKEKDKNLPFCVRGNYCNDQPGIPWNN